MSTNNPPSLWRDFQIEPSPRNLRQKNPEVVAAHAVTVALRPHVAKFDRWTAQAARLGALSLANALSLTERAEAAEQMASLRNEVEAAFAVFREDMATQHAHARIADVTRSFERLLALLSR